MNFITGYVKFWIALLGGTASWGITAAEDSLYTQGELWGLLAVIATSLGVLVVENKKPAPRRRARR